MNNQTGGNRGFIKWILLIVAALLVISYFGINLRQLVTNPTTQDNISYVASTTVQVWQNYLREPVTYVWRQIFIEMIWKPAWRNITAPSASTTPTFSFETADTAGEPIQMPKINIGGIED